MALPGEIPKRGKDQTAQCSCGQKLPLEVLQSAGGYYLGWWCNECGPFGRLTGYYESLEDAERRLKTGDYKERGE